MSLEAIQEFYNFVQTQPEIQNELNLLLNDREGMIAKAVELGRENNCNFTADELRKTIAELETSQAEDAELTDEVLEAVAGGAKGGSLQYQGPENLNINEGGFQLKYSGPSNLNLRW
jgi:hypothetical protein